MNTQKAIDMSQLALGRLIEEDNLRFSNRDGVATLTEHVERHRDLINAKHGITADWHEALFSWSEEVFTPIIRTISPWSYRRTFPQTPLGDLYLAVSDHWGYLKERDVNATPIDAARSFLTHYGTGFGRHFSRFLVPSTW